MQQLQLRQQPFHQSLWQALSFIFQEIQEIYDCQGFQGTGIIFAIDGGKDVLRSENLT